jgi:hypothetical protein
MPQQALHSPAIPHCNVNSLNYSMLTRLNKPTNVTPFAQICRAKTWCALVALITALAFISLVSTAATHYHTTTQDSQDCSVCSVVSHKVGGSFAAPTVKLAQFFVLFEVALTVQFRNFFSCTNLYPPGCGPPTQV